MWILPVSLTAADDGVVYASLRPNDLRVRKGAVSSPIIALGCDTRPTLAEREAAALAEIAAMNITDEQLEQIWPQLTPPDQWDDEE